MLDVPIWQLLMTSIADYLPRIFRVGIQNVKGVYIYILKVMAGALLFN